MESDRESIIVQWDVLEVKADVIQEDTDSVLSKCDSISADSDLDETQVNVDESFDIKQLCPVNSDNDKQESVINDTTSNINKDEEDDPIVKNNDECNYFVIEDDKFTVNMIQKSQPDLVVVKKRHDSVLKSQEACSSKKGAEPSVVKCREDCTNKCILPQCSLNHIKPIMLTKCKHVYFRECLAKVILTSNELTIRCPFRKGNLYCLSEIAHDEIRKILTPNEYDEYLTLSLLNAEKQSDNAFRCKTPKCIGWCFYEEGATIFQCPVCKKCNCLLCKSIHLTRPCKRLDVLLNYPNERNTDSLARTKNNAQKLYPKLLDLYRAEIVLYPGDFVCPICMDNFFPMEGIILKNCLHVFCRLCLQQMIKLCETEEVKCPHKDNEYRCESSLFEYEIKALLSPSDYEERLVKTLKIAESKMENTFHCKTPDCTGWCIVEEAIEFNCYVCGKINCIICSVIHDRISCAIYQDRLLTDVRTDNEDYRSSIQLETLIRDGAAMNCPQCGSLIMKTEGCDGITCSQCNTDICWITKQRRWGPRGKGDWSGGCQCKYNGRRCHPLCSNCH